MSDFVEKMAAEGLLTPEQVDRIDRRVAEFVKAAQTDPSLLREAQEKLAADPAGMFSHIPWKQTAGTLLAAAGIQAAGNAASDAYYGVKDAVKKARSYKMMLDQNPQLAKADSKAVQRAFNTIHSFNPQYAADPSVAGQFVQDSMELERMPIEQINQMVKARSDLANSRRNQGFSVGGLPTGMLGQRSTEHPDLPVAQLESEQARGFKAQEEAYRARAEQARAQEQARYYRGLQEG
jgi:hypothetical protein